MHFIYIAPYASEALFVSHVYSAPSQGCLRQGRLGFEHDTLRLLPLPPYKGTQPIRPTSPNMNKCNLNIKLLLLL